MQFQDYKALILTGDTPKERLRVIRQFVPKNFEDMMHVNLKNNQKVVAAVAGEAISKYPDAHKCRKIKIPATGSPLMFPDIQDMQIGIE